MYERFIRIKKYENENYGKFSQSQIISTDNVRVYFDVWQGLCWSAEVLLCIHVVR